VAARGNTRCVCRKCCNKIPMEDLEGILHQELKGFFARPEKIALQFKEAMAMIRRKAGAKARMPFKEDTKIRFKCAIEDWTISPRDDIL
jgi:hypothetical protein